MPQTWRPFHLGRQRRRPPLLRDKADRNKPPGFARLPRRAGRRRRPVARTAAPIRPTFRERRIHLKTRFALTPFARATPATDAPGVRAASTIR